MLHYRYLFDDIFLVAHASLHPLILKKTLRPHGQNNGPIRSDEAAWGREDTVGLRVCFQDGGSERVCRGKWASRRDFQALGAELCFSGFVFAGSEGKRRRSRREGRPGKPSKNILNTWSLSASVFAFIIKTRKRITGSEPHSVQLCSAINSRNFYLHFSPF